MDETKLMDLVGQAVSDFGATLNTQLVAIGDKLGLYRALAAGGPMTASELASRTTTAERYVREWLAAQAASGYVTYDAATERFSLSEEQAEALTNEDSPVCVLGGFQWFSAAGRVAPRLLERFRTGEGLGWHEHDPELFEGTERFFRPIYLANLTTAWIPALDGVHEKLAAGARVADVGCGHGASTVILAQAYPNSTFVGFDYHQPSVAAARERALTAGLEDRARFEVASGKDYPGTYDLVCHFDCLHDMGDPVGAAAHTLESLAPDGTWMIVEPFANDRLGDNLNPIGRAFYAASTFACTPASLSQEVGLALGGQAGEARLREVVEKAGFTRFRRATETPFNLVFEARP